MNSILYYFTKCYNFNKTISTLSNEEFVRPNWRLVFNFWLKWVKKSMISERGTN